MVQTCRGSHTHTLLTDPKDKDNVYVYVAGSAGVRPAEELAGCSGGEPSEDPNTALFTIVVIKVPLAHPELAKVVNSPRIFSDPQTGAMDGLWKGRPRPRRNWHTPPPYRGCHDITIYSAIGLVAGACSGNGILLDIKDPVHPKRIEAVSRPELRLLALRQLQQRRHQGRLHRRVGRRHTTPLPRNRPDALGRGRHLHPRQRQADPRRPTTRCPRRRPRSRTASPTTARWFRSPAATSWCRPGTRAASPSWTSPTQRIPYEIAYFDRGPVDPDKHIIGGAWSAYWYNGYIYGSEIARGVDVFKLVPSKFITQNEIDAANQVHFDELNVQNQPKIIWPQNLITAKAYVDQLARTSALTVEKATAINMAIDGKKTKELKTFAASLDKDSASATAPGDAAKMKMLAEILKK